MNLSALVLHNHSRDTFFRYDPETSHLFHAHEFQIVADDLDLAADLIWTLTNVGDANELSAMRPDLGIYGPQVTAYRKRGNRSLSVGDVIVFRDLERPPGEAPQAEEWHPEDLRFLAAKAVAGIGFQTLYVPPYVDTPRKGMARGSNTSVVSHSNLALDTHWRALNDS